MANQNPPKKNQAFNFPVGLEDLANPGTLKVAPTIAAGDFQISKDFGTFNDLATLPDVEPDGTDQVRVQLSATECNCDVWMVRWKDQTNPKEWADGYLSVSTTA